MERWFVIFPAVLMLWEPGRKSDRGIFAALARDTDNHDVQVCVQVLGKKMIADTSSGCGSDQTQPCCKVKLFWSFG